MLGKLQLLNRGTASATVPLYSGCCARLEACLSDVALPGSPPGKRNDTKAAVGEPVGQLPPPYPELVEKYLGTGVMSRQQLLKTRKEFIIQEFQRFPGDVGSTEVQVALLTDRIRSLEPHFAAHKHDFHSKRGMRALLNQRRSLLEYLRRTNFKSYCALITKLDMKDLFIKQKRLDTYRTGTQLPYKTEPLKRYLFKK